MRTQEIYEITKNEIANGADIYGYISIMYGLFLEEDYESMEGIRLAIADLGLQLTIPNTEDELNELTEFLKQP
jgi:hypothetical protein